MKVFKRLAAMSAAVMMMASISAIGASAFSGTACPKTTGGTKTGYMYCMNTGSHTYNTVSGTARTAGTTVYTLTKPKYDIQGNIDVTLSAANGGGNAQHTYGNSVSCSLSTKITTSKTTVRSTHSISNTGSYGLCSYTLTSYNV